MKQQQRFHSSRKRLSSKCGSLCRLNEVRIPGSNHGQAYTTKGFRSVLVARDAPDVRREGLYWVM